MASEGLFKDGVAVCGGKFTLKVSRDRLEAVVVQREAGAGSVKDIDQGVLHAELQSAGVVHGLLERPVARSDGSYCVAQGTPAVNGENARVKAYVKPGVAHLSQVKDPSKDKIDFHELHSIVNVPKDKLLIEKVPLTLGTAGRAVTGEELTVKPGKDIVLKVGPGITLSEDGCKGIAAVEGKFVLVEGKPAVMVEHIVNGDIDYNVGNIAFAGQRLIINGAIQPGFKVKCKGDISIAQGIQYSAEVSAGGNLEIKGGVMGHDIVIKCWGNVHAVFLDNVGRIEVKGDLTVTESMVQVHAMVGGNIRVLGGNGVLAGGHYVVGGSVFVKELGSADEVLTEISVGVNPVLEEKKEKLYAEKDLWAGRMNDLIRNTTGLKALQKEKGKAFPPEQAELLKKYKEMLPQAVARVSQLTEAEEALLAEIEHSAGECIYVYDTLHPGAKISIGGVTRILNAQESGVVVHFDRDGRQIRCRGMSPEERQSVA